jgi:hypothetical protein
VKSLRTWLLVFFAATTLGGALIAWRQYNELVELRAQALTRDERALLQKRVWELEKSNREMQRRSVAARSGEGVADASTEGVAQRGGAPGDPRGRGAGGLQQMNAIRELMTKPEVQAMISLQQKGGIESRYAALFKNLNLSSNQAASLNALLAERATTRQDVFNAAREQGIDPRTNPESFRKLLADSQAEINRSIKSVIGENGFTQLQTYEQTLPQRSVVEELGKRLSYTDTPLTPAQSEQLVQILASNTPTRPTEASSPNAGPPPPPPFGNIGPPPGGGRGGPDIGGMVLSLVGGGGPPGVVPDIIDGALRVSGAPVTSAAVAQAQTVLAPPQVAALQQIQQQQQAQQQLQQVLREAVPPGPRTTPPAQPAPPANSGRPGGR